MNTRRPVLFAHGSRDSRWREPIEKRASSVAAEFGPERVRLACLEKFRPALFDVAAEAVREGFLAFARAAAFPFRWCPWSGRSAHAGCRGANDVSSNGT